jgi:hypothetical protein
MQYNMRELIQAETQKLKEQIKTEKELKEFLIFRKQWIKSLKS